MKKKKIEFCPLGPISVKKLMELIPKKVKEMELNSCAKEGRPEDLRGIEMKEKFLTGSASGNYIIQTTPGNEKSVDITYYNYSYNFVI